ncbi:MAG: hypothetical protein ACOCRN_03395 [Spirochaetia bacterium]
MMSAPNLRISVRVILFGVAALFVFSCSDSGPRTDAGNGDPERKAESSGGAGRETPEPGSGPVEELDMRTGGDGERSSSGEPRGVRAEQLLLLPNGTLPEPVAPRDTSMEVELAGEFLTGAEREFYRIIDRFLTRYAAGEIPGEYLSSEYASSVRRRLEPAIDSGRLPEGWRIGLPQRSTRGAAVPVRLFASTDSRSVSAEGSIYLDESGLIEDIQIDVRALGVE